MPIIEGQPACDPVVPVVGIENVGALTRRESLPVGFGPGDETAVVRADPHGPLAVNHLLPESC